MTLGNIIAKLNSASDNLWIVAKRPWTSEAAAKLVSLTDDFRVPPDALADGYEYFLEVATARDEVLGDLALDGTETIEVLIYYAENDAFPHWLNERGGDS